MVNALSQMVGTLALDFDGVLCNGLREYFQASCRAYQAIWPEPTEAITSALEPPFQKLRPLVTHGWEMPLVLRALQQGYGLTEIEQSWDGLKSQLLAVTGLSSKALETILDGVRDAWIETDWQGWLSLHEFYPGIVTQLQAWQKADIPWLIITTKETRFVTYLLAQAAITPPPLGIYGKDTQQTKVEVLLELQQRLKSPIWFVEDRLDALFAVMAEPHLAAVELFLAAWGYTTPAACERARADQRIHLLQLEQFSQDFPAWIAGGTN